MRRATTAGRDQELDLDTIVVESVDHARRVQVPDPARVAYATQTTLSVDETAEIVAALRKRFPKIKGPDEGDICYATTNRQQAVKELAAEIDILLVIGSQNSSNSNRLVETARAAGIEAHLIEDESGIVQAIVRPDLFRENRALIVGSPGLVVEGPLQKEGGNVSVRAERFWPLPALPDLPSHDFR